VVHSSENYFSNFNFPRIYVKYNSLVFDQHDGTENLGRRFQREQSITIKNLGISLFAVLRFIPLPVIASYH
jgi:hypothetical protein